MSLLQDCISGEEDGAGCNFPSRQITVMPDCLMDHRHGNSQSLANIKAAFELLPIVSVKQTEFKFT